MTKKEILDAIHGKMIISCQAVEGEPLYVEEKSIMYLMARAAKQAGTPAIRTQYPRCHSDQRRNRSSGDRAGEDPVSRV